MAYDEGIEFRIDELAGRWRGFSKKNMFGGIGYLLHGNMCFGIWKDSLVVRCGPDRYVDLLEQPHVDLFDITGKAMTGWVMVAPDGFLTDAELKAWLETAKTFVRGLPKKSNR